jgi:hypothetical protein
LLLAHEVYLEQLFKKRPHGSDPARAFYIN